MSRSYKKNAYCSAPAGVNKRFKTIYNRKVRRTFKHKKYHVEDLKSFSLNQTTKGKGTYAWWDWVYYGGHRCRCRYEVQLLNYCEVEKHRRKMAGYPYTWATHYAEKHSPYCCDCYTNKRTSRYWKAKRK